MGDGRLRCSRKPNDRSTSLSFSPPFLSCTKLAEQTVFEGIRHVHKVMKCFRVKKRRRHSSREKKARRAAPSHQLFQVVERHH